MQSHPNVTKEEILKQLKKEGVNDLDEFAEFLVKKAHQDGDVNKPVTTGVIIYNHGFVTS